MKEFNLNENNRDGKNAFYIVFLFFLVVISVNLTMYYLAYRSFDGLVDENYYKKGLNYQVEQDQKFSQEKLRWKINLSFSKSLYKVSVKDVNGNNIKNAMVKLIFFRPTSEGFDKSFNLKEISPGIYEKNIVLPLPGIWDVYIEIQKEKNKWQKKQRISV